MSSSNYNKGFTLIETFVAITILILAVLGPMLLLANFLKDASQAENQIAASFYAQEGLELVLDKVNSNRMAMSTGDGSVLDWLSGLNDTGDKCYKAICTASIDVSNNVTFGDQTGSLIVPILGTQTNPVFNRTIQITCQDPADPTDTLCVGAQASAKIISKVAWTYRGITRSIQLETVVANGF